MNEPDLTVALIYAGVLLSVPLVHALIMAACAKRGRWLIWAAWAAGFVPIAAGAWPLTAPLRSNPADDRLFANLIIAAGVTTAAAAWVIDWTTRRQPLLPFWRLAATAIATVIGVAIALVIPVILL